MGYAAGVIIGVNRFTGFDDLCTYGHIGLRKTNSEMGFTSHVLSEYLVIDKAECLFGMRSTRCKAMEV